MEKNSDRNITIDVLRGIAILLVVLGHTMTGCTDNSESSFLFNVLWTIQMPLFFLISGYVTKYSRTVATLKDYIEFVGKKTFSYLLPWVVWTFLIRGIIFGEASYLNIKFIMFNMDTGYWFLFSLWTIVMIYGAARFICEKIAGNRSELFQFSIFTLGYLLGMAVLVLIGVKFGLTFLCIKLTLYYMPFYFLGYMFSEFEKRNYINKLSFLTELIVAIALAVWIGLMLRFNFSAIDDNLTGIMLRIAASLSGSIAVCGLISKSIKKINSLKIWKFLSYAGKKSLEIYLMHYLLLSMVRYEPLPKFASPVGILSVMFNYLLTISLTLAVIIVIKQNRILDLIGFAKKHK